MTIAIWAELDLRPSDTDPIVTWWLIGPALATIALAIVREQRARKRGAPPPDRTIRLHTIAPRGNDPFRTASGPQRELPAERAAEPRQIEDVIAALRAGGL